VVAAAAPASACSASGPSPSSSVGLGESTLTLNTCTVALSLVTANHFESGEKAMQLMSALSVPLLSYRDMNMLSIGT
jgi:hypothetical protein